jgi:ribosomal-protein-alanine acetyltransferase
MTPQAVPLSSVRPLEARDAEAIQRILRRCPEAAGWSSGSFQVLAGHLAWVAESSGSVCGFLVASTAADQGEILNLAIDPASRRDGHASRLVHRALSEFQRFRIADVFLEVRESNSAALSFYESLGFVRTGRRPAYYQNPAEAAVLMVRKLTA